MVVQKATLSSIAGVAGVSINTVSRALRDKSDIGEITKARIRRLAGEFDYQPDEIARSLVLGRTFTIGLVILTLDNPFYGNFATFVNAAARECGYSLQLMVLDSLAHLNHYVETLTRKTAAGVIFIPFLLKTAPAIRKLRKKGIACALSGYSHTSAKGDSIVVDRASGTRQAVEHLTRLGRRKIIYLCSPEEGKNRFSRTYGYERAMEASGLKPFIVRDGAALNTGYRAMRKILERRQSCDAVFCHNDLTAFGAMQALYECGYSIPDDVAVAGFDNIPESAYSHPSLTTVAQPVETVSRRLVEMLMQRIDQPKTSLQHELVAPSLVVRQSTAGKAS